MSTREPAGRLEFVPGVGTCFTPDVPPCERDEPPTLEDQLAASLVERGLPLPS